MSEQEQIKKLKVLVDQYEASTPYNYNLAYDALTKMTENNYMASDLVVEIRDLSGNTKAKFLVTDGFKDETIKTLQSEIVKSTKLKLSYFTDKFKELLK